MSKRPDSAEVVSRPDWLAARQALLIEEKTLTRARAAVAAKRRELPWVRVDDQYTFVGSQGEMSLADLFGAQSQLLVYHFMLGPGWPTPCPGCSQWAAALDRTTAQFAQADARLIVISRAPFDELLKVQREKGWVFTWYSSFGSRFNYDFYASNEDMSKDSVVQIGGPNGEKVHFDRGENHGVSVFVKGGDGEIFHTYSAYNRGIEELNGALGYLDLLPSGRAW